MRTFVLHRWSEFWFTIHPNTWIVNGKMKEIFRNMDIFSYIAYIVEEYVYICILSQKTYTTRVLHARKKEWMLLDLIWERGDLSD